MANFSSKTEGTWFYFDDMNHSLGGICLRELSPDESERIDKITTKKKKKPVRGSLMEVSTTNTIMASRLTWDYCITDWANIQLDDDDVPCDTDNKVKMMKIIDFAKFVGDCVTELVENNKSIEEAKLKNSGTSSSGKKKSPTVKDV